MLLNLGAPFNCLRANGPFGISPTGPPSSSLAFPKVAKLGVGFLGATQGVLAETQAPQKLVVHAPSMPGSHSAPSALPEFASPLSKAGFCLPASPPRGPINQTQHSWLKSSVLCRQGL